MNVGIVMIAGNGHVTASVVAVWTIGHVTASVVAVWTIGQVTASVVATVLVAVVPNVGSMAWRLFQRIANARDCCAGGIQREQKSEKKGEADAHGRKV